MGDDPAATILNAVWMGGWILAVIFGVIAAANDKPDDQ